MLVIHIKPTHPSDTTPMQVSDHVNQRTYLDTRGEARANTSVNEGQAKKG